MWHNVDLWLWSQLISCALTAVASCGTGLRVLVGGDTSHVQLALVG
jgi:hypothetical protein